MKTYQLFWPGLAVTGAGVGVALYLFTALPRLIYPYDLDFIENGMLMQALRYAQGLPVFVAPNGEFAPSIYMPGYPWLGGLLIQFFGAGYSPLRALSLAATLITTALIFLIARRESQTTWVALACAGLYLGGYRLSGFWYELARVDSLYVTLTLAAWASGVYGLKTTRGVWLSAALFALAFFTKQTALIFALGFGAYLVYARSPHVLVFSLSLGSLCLLPWLALNYATNGWFAFYTYTLATATPTEFRRGFNYLIFDLLVGMVGVSGMALLAFGLSGRRTGWKKLLAEQPWWMGLACAVLVGAVGRAPVGGNLNNLMPTYAFLCLAPALLLSELHIALPRRAEALLTLALSLQFAIGAYNPLRYIPTAEMQAQGDELITRLQAENGPVLVLMHPYYAVLAGQPPTAHMIYLWHFYEYAGLDLPEDLRQRIQSHYYAAIISDESFFETVPTFADFFRAHYPRAEVLPLSASPPTLSGWQTRPTLILRP